MGADGRKSKHYSPIQPWLWADRLLIGFTFKIKIRSFNQVLQPGRTQQQSPTAASPERYMQPYESFSF